MSCSLLQGLMTDPTVLSQYLLTQNDRKLAICAQDDTSFADTRCVPSDHRGQFRVHTYAGLPGAGLRAARRRLPQDLTERRNGRFGLPH